MAHPQSNQIETRQDGVRADLYLTFQVAEETYAVNTACVTEIVGVQHIVEPVDLGGQLGGSMNLRGKIIPVVDQQLRAGLPSRGYGKQTRIIVLDLNGGPVGLVVDRVTDVMVIPISSNIGA